jgi:hypothetical protein
VPQKILLYKRDNQPSASWRHIWLFIDCGHTHYSDRPMVMQLNQQEFEQSLEVLSATEQMRATRWKI